MIYLSLKKITTTFLVFAFLVPNLVLGQANDSFTVRVQYGDDTEAPSIPIVSAEPMSATQIDVTWTASVDNVAVAGYELTRNGLHISTTTATSYLDTGLAASTTYTYAVRAFDFFGNFSDFSALVSTTTFSLPPPAPTSTPPVDGSSSVTLLLPALSQFSLEPGTVGAKLSFTTISPVTFSFRYGVTDALDGGLVETNVFKRSHHTSLNDLKPDTRYQYELYGTDRIGRTVLLRSGNFVTEKEVSLSGAPNVTYFTATQSGQHVLLSWGLPKTQDVVYVRIVRSHYGYPISPQNGFVVYEGDGTSFLDSNALSKYDRQYYTIFTYTTDGVYSSGAVAVVGKDQPNLIPTTPSTISRPTSTEPSLVVDEEKVDPIEIILLGADLITIEQDGEIYSAEGDRFSLKTDSLFKIKVPASLSNNVSDVIIITWQHPMRPAQKTSYLLRLDPTGSFYEAVAAPLEDSGLYPLRLSLFDRYVQEKAAVTGFLSVSTPVSEKNEERPTESVVYVATIYLIVGGVIGLLTILGLWWVLVTLMRYLIRRR